MRLRSIGCLVVMFTLVVPLYAQEIAAPAEAASPEMIDNVLTELKSRYALEDGKYAVEVNKRQFKLYRLDDGKRLVLKAALKESASLQTINRYNEKSAATTRAVKYEKLGVMLEAGVDCQLGITEAGLKKFIVRFTEDIGDFEAFVAKAKDQPEEPKSVKKEKQKVPMQIKPDSDDKELLITFPTETKDWETAWKIVWDMETGKQANEQGFKGIRKGKDGKETEVPGFGGFREGAVVLFKIKKAYFKPGQNADWIQVLEDAHPSEFYVPYYFGGFSNTRFYDLKGVGNYTKLSPKEGGAISQTLSKGQRVIAELRDTGVAYKHGDRTRRGEELTLWANFIASNYTYMIEYGFQDNGTIVFRHAPTGYNFYAHFDAAHMHGSYWRIGVKLGPDGNNDKNSVYSVNLPTEPKEQGQEGKLKVKEITKESFLDWDPQAFTRIRITNPEYSIVPEAKDRPALPISYDLVTTPQGIARHKRFADEKFTHHDFWITRHDSPEKMYINLGRYFFNPAGEANPKLQELENKNVVLWHSSAALHVPRSEDGIIGGRSASNGQAMIYWTTFELRPRNLFLKTPIYRSLP